MNFSREQLIDIDQDKRKTLQAILDYLSTMTPKTELAGGHDETTDLLWEDNGWGGSFSVKLSSLSADARAYLLTFSTSTASNETEIMFSTDEHDKVENVSLSVIDFDDALNYEPYSSQINALMGLGGEFGRRDGYDPDDPWASM